MADNVTITQGAGSTPPDGTVVATDDVAGVQYQRVKLDVGGDGASTPVVGALPVSGTVTANAGTGPWPITDNGGSLTVDGTVAVSGNVAVTAAALPLPTGAATDTLQTAEAVLIGAVGETAPASDTGSSGLNGRLQRIAQRLTSLIALLPASLGQKASAASLAVVVASDQSAIPASQSGTWTVQPGNTPNTTAWKVDGSAVIQPVSGTVTANAGSGPFPVNDNAGSLTVDAPVGTPVFTRLSDGTTALTTAGGRLAVDASGVAVPVTDNAGSLTVDNAGTFAVQASQAGTWAVTPASSATDGTATQPSADLGAGWDGLNVRSLYVQALDGRNTLFVHDPTSRRLVEQLLIESRLTNTLLARLLGPQAPTQRELEPGAGLMN